MYKKRKTEKEQENKQDFYFESLHAHFNLFIFSAAYPFTNSC